MRRSVIGHDQVLAGRFLLNRYALPLRTELLPPLFEPDESRSGHEFPPEIPIVRLNDPCETVWIVVDGTARLTYPALDWSQRFSRLTVPGELVGLTEAFAGLPSAVTLVAVSRCSCLNLPLRYFIDRIEREPLFRAALISMLAAALCRESVSPHVSL